MHVSLYGRRSAFFSFFFSFSPYLFYRYLYFFVVGEGCVLVYFLRSFLSLLCGCDDDSDTFFMENWVVRPISVSRQGRFVLP